MRLIVCSLGLYYYTAAIFSTLQRDLNLRPADWCAGTLPTELSSTIVVAVSPCFQYFCAGLSVRIHKTVNCSVARVPK